MEALRAPTLPASFVVLQGSAGDGMANTLAVLPDFSNLHQRSDGEGRTSGLLTSSLQSVEEVDEGFDGGNDSTTQESYDSSSTNGGSGKENDKRNISTIFEDDTEGGLHLPLGSTSPIMRKLHHQAAYSLNCSIRPPPFDVDERCNSKQSHQSDLKLPPRSLQITQSPAAESAESAALECPAASQKPKHNSEQLHAIQQWHTTCREREIHSYEEVHQNIRAVLTQRRKQHTAATKNGSCSRPPISALTASSRTILKQLDHVEDMLELASKHKLWYQHDDKLRVFETVPHLSLKGVVTHPLLNRDGDEVVVSPGTVIEAAEWIVLDSRTLRQISPMPDSFKKCSNTDKVTWEQKHSAATVQLLKITSPYIGYIVSHLHGYPYVGPGSPLDYVPNYQQSTSNSKETIHWTWRVVYQPDGAYVRNGPELMSDQIGTLPYGSFCVVQEKIVNEMGLSRLKIRAWGIEVGEDMSSGEEKKDEERSEKGDGEEVWKDISGWTSLFINPLSGNSGHIVEPVDFPVPVLYKVICESGAVIRTGTEISTSEIGLAPKGTILSVVGRAFSDSPRSCCIERLRLAGGRGWISARLSESFSGDRRVVELVGLDHSFDPDNPADFHLKEQKKAMSELASIVNKNSSKVTYQRQLSEINDDSGSDQEQISSFYERNGLKQSVVSTTTLFQNGMPSSLIDHAHPNRCLICLSEERTATIVHGETGHVACCLTCARVLKARGDSCPVCREPIDTVIQHFWA